MKIQYLSIRPPAKDRKYNLLYTLLYTMKRKKAVHAIQFNHAYGECTRMYNHMNNNEKSGCDKIEKALPPGMIIVVL